MQTAFQTRPCPCAVPTAARVAFPRHPTPDTRHLPLGTFRGSLGMQGLNDDHGGWINALLGVYQAYQASVNQGRQDDVYVDYLRDQVHLALAQIRFLIRHGQVSPTQALQAGQQVISDFYRETGAMPRAQARQRAENYRAGFTADASLNQAEAEWFYQKWDCPDITTQAQIGTPRCVQLSVAADTPPGTGTTPGGGSVTPAPGSVGVTAPAATGSILDLLGSVDTPLGAIPLLPVLAIGGILLMTALKG